jgi:carboxypeptidase family protein
MTTGRFGQRVVIALAMSAAFAATGGSAWAQELGGAGTVQGTVKDPTGAAMVAVSVDLSNPVTGFKRSGTSDAAGKFVFRNIPPNPYHLVVTAQGFAPYEQDVNVRTAVPIDLEVPLKLAGTTESVSVVGHAEDLLERDPTAHTDIDDSLIAKLPLEASSSGLNQVIMMASPGIVADSNGFFHPVGDHAQTQFSIDNQPVTDQQSRIYSNQISPDAVQSMEVITGVAPAEYGDKSSLVVHIVTRSGLDLPKPTGSISASYGSFKSPMFEANGGGGSHTVGDFLSVTGLRTDRFLDPPEFKALHDRGTSASLFNRLDAHMGATSTFHLNVQGAQSSFDVPNTYDQSDAGQSQHEKIRTFNVAPGYSQVIGSKTLFTANVFVRQDHLTYTPSGNPFADTPGTVSQDRKLTNFGGKADVAYTTGAHNVKIGATLSATKLNERFTIGFTDPGSNDPANPGYDPNLAPYDLTRGGQPLAYAQAKTIKQQAAYAQDDIKAGNATFKLGLRVDRYDGLTTATLVEPRLGVSYAIPASNTVLRASYGRTLETPYNENLLLSSGVGLGGLFGDGQVLQPGRRNQGEFGIQQGIGSVAVVDFGYFVKRTRNGYDFNVLFSTPIVFPISWDHSKIDGFTGRINIVERKGFSAFVVMAHTSAIFSPPAAGGILVSAPTGPFRIDHDQKFNSTANFQYTFNKALGAWGALSWRYDSGLVAGSVGSIDDALALPGDQQAAIGFFCGGTVATRDNPIINCASGGGATRMRIPAAGSLDPVKNPPRVAPRHLVDLGFGADNLFHTDRTKVRLHVSVINVADKQALYNFLSTFSGTHFVTPRAVQVQLGVSF